jgi:hypothetical protein
MIDEVAKLVSAVWALTWSLVPLIVMLAVLILALLVVIVALVAWSVPIGARAEWSAAGADTMEYWQCVVFFLRGGDYTACPQFSRAARGRDIRARIFSMCLALRLWSEPHYRNGTFQDDMRKNLRNVAIPGTGVPLSLFAAHRALAWLFILAVYPVVSLVAAVIVARGEPEPWGAVATAYRAQLLCPEDWFGFWRMNCALASYHALVSQEPEYRQEDKLVFLEVAKSKVRLVGRERVPTVDRLASSYLTRSDPPTRFALRPNSCAFARTSPSLSGSPSTLRSFASTETRRAVWVYRFSAMLSAAATGLSRNCLETTRSWQSSCLTRRPCRRSASSPLRVTARTRSPR